MADETKDKCCPERVLALIANEASPFNDDDTEWLEALNEDQLANIEKLLPVEQEKEAEPEKVEEPEMVTLESYLEAAPVEIRAVLNEGMKALDAKRQAVIDRILNHDGSAFSEDQLKAMDTEMLEGIAKLIPEKKVKYDGANPANSVVLSEKQAEKPYVPVTLSDVMGKNNKEEK